MAREHAYRANCKRSVVDVDQRCIGVYSHVLLGLRLPHEGWSPAEREETCSENVQVSPSALKARDFPPVVPEQKAEQSSPMVPTRLVLAYSGARSPPRAAWARVRAQAPHVLR